MREDPLWARIALLLNLAGTILLALSFQATSSDFRLVTAHNQNLVGQPAPGASVYAICVNNFVLAATDSVSGTSLGNDHCPDWENADPSAVVTAEHPNWLYIGLVLSALGFFIQLLTVPRRKTLAEVNEELRILRKRKRGLELEIQD